MDEETERLGGMYEDTQQVSDRARFWSPMHIVTLEHCWVSLCIDQLL